MKVDTPEILAALRAGKSSKEIHALLYPEPNPIHEPEPEQEPEQESEYVECMVIARRFIEAARQRAAFSVDRPDAYFPNPRDRQTHIDIRASQEIAMAFCNVKDSLGGQLGNSVDELAKRCVDAEAGSKKQSKIITELQEETPN